ncbi:Protein tipD [Trypanosoma theileri]|uniref:Protein tipD n=1 Tax=Trypanosoma theileri TaxID=67003 RepID=A0A1X0NWL7_9TRYP|nr:Protein tipD [Trypanosoma theileri]ORC88589.1 Protein tipD [Trypanosoma theileri]
METWTAVIERQILLRNAAEFQPMERVFIAHRVAQNQLLRSQQRLQELGDENAKLDEKNKNLAQHLRTLELAAAGVVNRTSREEELEAKVAELQKQVQQNITQEKDYYKSICEANRLTEENKSLKEELSHMKEQEKHRENVLRMMKHEYAALKQESEELRPKLCTILNERDRCIKDLLASKDTVAKMQEKILEYEDELNRIRKAKRQQGGDAATSTNTTSTNTTTTAPIHTDPAVLSGSASSVRRGEALARERETLLSLDVQPPSAVLYAIDGAHGDRMVYAACAADGGRLLITGGGDRNIRHWEFSTGKPLRTHSSTDVPLALDSTSHYLLAGCADGVTRFWDTHTLRTVELTGHSEKVVAAYLSQSAHSAFTASSDRTIKLWDVRRGMGQRTIMCTSTCNDLCVVDSYILSAHYNGSLWVWDRRTVGHSTEIKNAHHQGVTCVRIDPDGRRCVSLGRDNSICVRDVRDLKQELFRVENSDMRVSSNLTRLAISPDGKLCAVGNARGAVFLIKLDEGHILDTTLSGEHQNGVHSVIWEMCDSSPLLASIGEDKRVVVWK